MFKKCLRSQYLSALSIFNKNKNAVMQLIAKNRRYEIIEKKNKRQLFTCCTRVIG